MSGRDFYGNDIAAGDLVKHRDLLVKDDVAEVLSVDRDTCKITVQHFVVRRTRDGKGGVREVEDATPLCENSGNFVLVEKRS